MKRFCVLLLILSLVDAPAVADDHTRDDAGLSREQNAIFSALARIPAVQFPAVEPAISSNTTPGDSPSVESPSVESPSVESPSVESPSVKSPSVKSNSVDSYVASASHVDTGQVTAAHPSLKATRIETVQSKPNSSLATNSGRAVTESNKSTPDWRIQTSDTAEPATLRWTNNEPIGPPTKLTIRKAPPVMKMGLQERLKAKRKSSSRVRRVGYDYDDLQEMLKQDAEESKSVLVREPLVREPLNSVEDNILEPSFNEPEVKSDFDLERTYKVAAPARPESQIDSARDGSATKGSKQDEVESVLEQLRRELRKEMEQAELEKQVAQERLRDQAREQEPEEPKADSVIPRSAPKSIKNAASSPLDLSLDIDDDVEEDEDTAPDPDDRSAGDTPPTPSTPGAPARNPSNWHQSPWMLDSLNEQDQPNPCEPYFCRQMWDCAGGRSQSFAERAMRNIERTYHVTNGRSNESKPSDSNVCVPGNRPICGPAFGSRCNVGLWRKSTSVSPPSRTCDGSCGAPQSCHGCVLRKQNCTSGNCTKSGCTGNGCTGGGCTGSKKCASCANDCEPWTLWGSMFQCEPQVSLSGWTSAGYHSRANGRFNNHPDAFNVHQSWLALERVADTSKRDIDWGFRFDVMYGVDAQDTQAYGNSPGVWDYRNGLDHGRYGWAVPQAYSELAFGNTSILMGHFYTLMGYEVVTAPDNFFYSHSMSMYLSEPFTHTGVLARTKQSDFLEFYYGWTLGWDTAFDQVNDGNSFLGGFKVQLAKNLSATYINSAGDFGVRGSGYAHSLVFASNPSDKWGLVVQSDLLRIQDEDNVAINSYVFRHLNDMVSVGSRVEWWKGDNVTGYAPFGAVLPANGSFSYYGATFGANFRVGSNVTIRPESRIDWSPALNYSVGTGGVDVVLTY